MLSLIDRIESVAANPRGRVTFASGDETVTIGWDELHRDARVAAAVLQSRGVRPGDHVALIGPTTQRLITAIQATWLAGAALVTMPLPMRMGAIDQFISQTRARILRSDTKVVVIDADLAAFIEPEPGDPPFITLDELFPSDGPGEDDYLRPPQRPRRPGHPAVHLGIDVGAQGRDAPAPRGVPQPGRRLVRSAGSPRTRSSSRGCRCTTTWVLWVC